MLKLWGRATSLNVQKVVWALEEIGVPYERVDVGGRHGGLDHPDYIARNPNQRIPTVEDAGTVVWESNAVVRYVAARYSEGRLWDADPGRRAQADQWMDWMQTTLSPDFYAVFWGVVRTLPQNQDKAAIAVHLKSLGEHFALLDRQLEGRPFLTGDSLSMADIVNGATLYRYHEMEIERPVLPRLAAWYERLRERPAYRKAVMVSFDELRAR